MLSSQQVHNFFDPKWIEFSESKITVDAWSESAIRLQDLYPEKFKYFPIKWDKYPDGTDDITISGFLPKNEIVGEHILFFASFHNNDVTLSQMSVLIVLLQSFIASMTIVLPFFPVGTSNNFSNWIWLQRFTYSLA